MKLYNILGSGYEPYTLNFGVCSEDAPQQDGNVYDEVEKILNGNK